MSDIITIRAEDLKNYKGDIFIQINPHSINTNIKLSQKDFIHYSEDKSKPVWKPFATKQIKISHQEEFLEFDV